jgi:hypothetical protein
MERESDERIQYRLTIGPPMHNGGRSVLAIPDSARRRDFSPSLGFISVVIFHFMGPTG